MVKKYGAFILAMPFLAGMANPVIKLPILQTPAQKKITRHPNSEFLVRITYDSKGTPHVRAIPII